MVHGPYTIQFAPRAATIWRMLKLRNRKLLAASLSRLAVNPRPEGVRRLEGLSELYTFNLSHCHVVYKIIDPMVIVLLIRAREKDFRHSAE